MGLLPWDWPHVQHPPGPELGALGPGHCHVPAHLVHASVFSPVVVLLTPQPVRAQEPWNHTISVGYAQVRADIRAPLHLTMGDAASLHRQVMRTTTGGFPGCRDWKHTSVMLGCADDKLGAAVRLGEQLDAGGAACAQVRDAVGEPWLRTAPSASVRLHERCLGVVRMRSVMGS